MRIIIVGAGFTGFQLAKRLIAEKKDVVLIDSDEETLQYASDRLDCMVIQGEGNSIKTLKSAGIAHADALVVITESDEVNMITCLLVEPLYPKLIKIARVRNYSYYENTQDSAGRGTLMVNPDVEAAEALVRAIEHGASGAVTEFGGSDFLLTRIAVENGSTFDGVAVSGIRQKTDLPCVIAFVEKEEKAFLPSGATVIQAGNVLGIVTQKAHVASFAALCGSETHVLKKIAIIGAGKIGLLVAERLLGTANAAADSHDADDSGDSRGSKRTLKNMVSSFFHSSGFFRRELTIIDKDRKRAEAAAERFPHAAVFRTDVTDESFADEEGLKKFDLAVCSTHNHELNIVVSGYLKSIGVNKTVSLVSTGEFANIARKTGSDVAIPLRETIVDTILTHLRGRHITGVHTVSAGELEIIEYEVSEKSPVAGRALKEIAAPGKFLILLIRAAGKTGFTVPTGNTVLATGDRLVVILLADAQSGWERGLFV
ncbi:MAG: Trk system potassium transporter TrkA [Treponemataceae bacterium]|nr:MAG: Trk system potassium transporter TrkA [Treponemataceae bacterium]